ncbi:ComEA family DNA-binding protein [Galbibacter pacificus]|uniref:ComEA family DNA-binding protein n=1 Tax=Galbibacter pacificus TaxID=2996052 RepID=UPI0038B40A48
MFKQFAILQQPKFTPVNVNLASIKKLSSLPYLDWKIAKKIVTYRTSHIKINSISELKKIEDFPTEKLNRIELYLTTE